jgi:hypothetical protein
MYAVGRLALALLAGHEVGAADQADIPITDPRLREVVHGLLLADPAKRPASAPAARTMLLGAQRSAVPWTGDGDPITVLDQLPPLPDGWGDAGEIPVSSSSEQSSAKGARATLVESALTAPIRSAGSAPPENRPLPGRPRGRSWRVVGAVTGLLLVVVVGVVFARSLDEVPGVVTTPPDTSVSTPPGTASGPATVPVTTDAVLRAGDTCGWQLEGDRRSTSDGELVCAVDAGAYRWVVASG